MILKKVTKFITNTHELITMTVTITARSMFLIFVHIGPI